MLAFALAPAASASPLLTLGDDGAVAVREDPYLPADVALPGAGAGAGQRPPGAGSRRSSATRPTGTGRPLTAAAAARRRTVGSELKRMLGARAIDRATYDARLATLASARRLLRGLSGARR